MDKRMKLLSLLFAFFVLMVPSNAFAQTDLQGREEVFEFLGKAFDSQVSLSEKGRSMEQIDQILNRYFTEDYKSRFIEENVVGQENDFQTYGTDFAPYYIPFYAFSEKTKVVEMDNEDEIYVVEFFPETAEGPVGYEDHYEGLKIAKKDDGWKVAEYLYDQVPQEVINKAYPEKVKQEAKPENEDKPFGGEVVIGPNFSAMKTFLEFGVIFRNENRTLMFGLL